jgi:hypothetical protein
MYVEGIHKQEMDLDLADKHATDGGLESEDDDQEDETLTELRGRSVALGVSRRGDSFPSTGNVNGVPCSGDFTADDSRDI